jgi:hypothetical protein
MSATMTITTESGEYIVVPRDPTSKSGKNANKFKKFAKKAFNKNNKTQSQQEPINEDSTSNEVHQDDVSTKKGSNKHKNNNRLPFTSPQIESSPSSSTQQPMTPGPQQALTTLPNPQSIKSTKKTKTQVTKVAPVVPQQQNTTLQPPQPIEKQRQFKQHIIVTTTTTTTVVEDRFGTITQPQIQTLSILATYIYIQMVKHTLSTYTYGCQYLSLLQSSQSTLEQVTFGLFSAHNQSAVQQQPSLNPYQLQAASSSSGSLSGSKSMTKQDDDSTNVFNYHSLFFKPIPIPISTEMEGVLARVGQLNTSELTYNALIVQNTSTLEYIGCTIPKVYQPHIIALYQHLCEVIISPDCEVRKIVLKLLLSLKYKLGNGIF